MKKGQGLSINVVIIAAIALIVLIILVLLVIKSGKTVTNTSGEKSCLSQGGECMPQGTCGGTTDYKEVEIGSDYCRNQRAGTICCRYNFGG